MHHALLNSINISRSLMATRLLDGSCANNEFEDLVKKLLFLKNGQGFVSKINGMQVDVSSGSAMVSDYILLLLL